MREDLICLIAFILGWIVCRMMGDGYTNYTNSADGIFEDGMCKMKLSKDRLKLEYRAEKNCSDLNGFTEGSYGVPAGEAEPCDKYSEFYNGQYYNCKNKFHGCEREETPCKRLHLHRTGCGDDCPKKDCVYNLKDSKECKDPVIGLLPIGAKTSCVCKNP